VTYGWIRAFADASAPWTFQNRRTDPPLRSNPLQHRVQVTPQLNDGVEGQARASLGPQALDHFRKPDSGASPAALPEGANYLP
jgi:hypothetical protein